MVDKTKPVAQPLIVFKKNNLKQDYRSPGAPAPN